MKKLKPVVFVQGKYAYNEQNTTQQIMLLKALRITQDPKKLRNLIGVQAVSDVYRTLDKIAMRKEYHNALAKSGITFDYVVENIKETIDNAKKDSDKLAGLKMILQSIGLDKYAETAIGGGGWEEIIEKINSESKEQTEERSKNIVDYEVVAPKIPDAIQKKRTESLDATKQLYE